MNGSNGLILITVTMQQYWCMSPLESNSITADGFARAPSCRTAGVWMAHVGSFHQHNHMPILMHVPIRI
jgi:hypothetical protein